MLDSPLQDRFKLIHFETGSRGAESPAKDESFHRKAFRIFVSPFALAWHILRLWPAIVHLNSAMDHKAFWRDMAYLFICKLFGRKVVFQLHGGSLTELCATPGMLQVVRSVFSLPDAIVLLANSEKKEFEELGITKRLFIIPNAVDVAQYAGPSERAHSGKVRRMACMARLIRPKGIFEAMEATRSLRTEDSFPDVELWIAGSGPGQEEIKKWIREHEMEGCVKLVGPIYGQDKIKFLREADVFVFPTYHKEGLPYTILESLAAGTPVIASRVAGIPDVVIDRVHGILIDAKDPRQIVNAIRELSKSAEDLRTMSRNCTDWAAERLGLERLATQFGELYERLQA